MSRWTGAKRYSGGSSRSLVSNCIRERVADSELFGVKESVQWVGERDGQDAQWEILGEA